MKQKFSHLVFLVVAAVIISSCDDSFSPSGGEKPRMVVYSILTTESDVQYVRVFKNYYPENNDPALNIEDNPVTDAIVTIFDGITTYEFHDTLVARDDTSRYQEPIFAYVANGFNPEPGVIYTLEVVSPTYGTITAQTLVPSSSTATIAYPYLFEQPYLHPTLTPQFSFSLSNYTSAYKTKFFIEFESDTDSGRVVQRWEVPEILRVISCFFEIYDFIYPSVTRVLSGSQGTQQFAYFSYRRSVELLNRKLNMSFRSVIFYVTQFDQNWYTYYATARTFQDQYSFRLDEPDYTNLRNGVGLFASMTVDSVSHPLPASILWPFPSAEPSTCE